MMPIVFPLMGGMVHKLEVGAKRFVDGISDERYKSGVFYASKEGKLSGDMVDQSTFFTDLKNTSFQETPTRQFPFASAQALKKFSGPIEAQRHPHLHDRASQEAAWQAVVKVSGVDFSSAAT